MEDESRGETLSPSKRRGRRISISSGDESDEEFVNDEKDSERKEEEQRRKGTASKRPKINVPSSFIRKGSNQGSKDGQLRRKRR